MSRHSSDGDPLTLTKINGSTITPGQQIAITQYDQTVGHLIVHADGSLRGLLRAT
ncbi:MAG: hypothetical protein NZ914_14835 [Gemmatales bacterium]|nr:hypothetical protein [Gemmatales bacterium]